MFCHIIKNYFLANNRTSSRISGTEKCCIMSSWIITPHFHGPTFTPHAPQISSRFCHKLRPYRLQININRTCKYFYARILSNIWPTLSHTCIAVCLEPRCCEDWSQVLRVTLPQPLGMRRVRESELWREWSGAEERKLDLGLWSQTRGHVTQARVHSGSGESWHNHMSELKPYDTFGFCEFCKNYL